MVFLNLSSLLMTKRKYYREEALGLKPILTYDNSQIFTA